MSGQKRMQWKEEDMVAALGAVNTDSLTSGICLTMSCERPSMTMSRDELFMELNQG